MTDITPLFNEALKRHNARPTTTLSLSLQHIDEFLKEAYRINSHIASLNDYLRSIRQSYLSTTQPSRRHHAENIKSKDKWRPLTDQQRDEIDAETKQLLRELNFSIRTLADTEQLRQNTETTLIRKKYGTKLGALSSWAAGGIGQSKSAEQELAEAKASTISIHRQNVLWYLRQKLQQCGSFQAAMMEKRILREMEKNKSVLYKARGKVGPEYTGPSDVPVPAFEYKSHMEGQFKHNVEDELTPEQLQMFEKENQDMVRHYEETLNQVRTAEKSLVEISELQTSLVNNLSVQAEHISQLVSDASLTADHIGRGNKELKRASGRPSMAKYIFYASCGASLFLVVYDLVI